MGRGACSQLVLGFSERDVKALFAVPRAFDQELKRERRLSRAGFTLHQVKPISLEATNEHVVQPFDTAASQLGKGGKRFITAHFSCLSGLNLQRRLALAWLMGV